MFNLKTRTKRIVCLFILLYLVAFASSSFDLKGQQSNVFCGIMTVGLLIGCAWMFCRAVRLAIRIENAPHWYSRCCCRKSAIQVMLGYACLMLVLGSLKLWSIGDVFIDMWSQMPQTYHLRAWAYLAQNAMDVFMAGIVMNIFSDKYECAMIKKKMVDGEMILCMEE